MIEMCSAFLTRTEDGRGPVAAPCAPLIYSSAYSFIILYLGTVPVQIGCLKFEANLNKWEVRNPRDASAIQTKKVLNFPFFHSFIHSPFIHDRVPPRCLRLVSNSWIQAILLSQLPSSWDNRCIGAPGSIFLAYTVLTDILLSKWDIPWIPWILLNRCSADLKMAERARCGGAWL